MVWRPRAAVVQGAGKLAIKWVFQFPINNNAGPSGVCGRSLAGVVGSNFRKGMDVCLLRVLGVADPWCPNM